MNILSFKHKSVNQTDALSLKTKYSYLDSMFTVFGEVDAIKFSEFWPMAIVSG